MSENTKQTLNSAENGNKSKPMLCEVVLRKQFTQACDNAVTFSEQYESYQKISDEFAIKFSNWLDKNYIKKKGAYYHKGDWEFSNGENNKHRLIELFKRNVFDNLT